MPLESTLSLFSVTSNKLHQTRVLKKKDKIGNINQAWKQIEKKLEKEKLPEKGMEYLDNLKVYRQIKLINEPYINEDSVSVSVLHKTLGKKQRFFYSDEKCCQIYYWIDRLSAEPEFFHLHYKRSCTAPSICVLDPNLIVTAVERTILTMSEVTEGNLTINIIDQHRFFKK